MTIRDGNHAHMCVCVCLEQHMFQTQTREIYLSHWVMS